MSVRPGQVQRLFQMVGKRLGGDEALMNIRHAAHIARRRTVLNTGWRQVAAVRDAPGGSVLSNGPSDNSSTLACFSNLVRSESCSPK